MLRLLRLLFVPLAQLFRSRKDLLPENLALRQQLAVLRRRHPQPRFGVLDRLSWVMMRRLWLGWKQALILVQPETVVRWRRGGFKAYWTWICRHRARAGRKCVSKELRELIFRMVIVTIWPPGSLQDIAESELWRGVSIELLWFAKHRRRGRP
jgi:hypothetical protein